MVTGINRFLSVLAGYAPQAGAVAKRVIGAPVLRGRTDGYKLAQKALKQIGTGAPPVVNDTRKITTTVGGEVVENRNEVTILKYLSYIAKITSQIPEGAVNKLLSSTSGNKVKENKATTTTEYDKPEQKDPSQTSGDKSTTEDQVTLLEAKKFVELYDMLRVAATSPEPEDIAESVLNLKGAELDQFLRVNENAVLGAILAAIPEENPDPTSVIDTPPSTNNSTIIGMVVKLAKMLKERQKLPESITKLLNTIKKKEVLRKQNETLQKPITELNGDDFVNAVRNNEHLIANAVDHIIAKFGKGQTQSYNDFNLLTKLDLEFIKQEIPLPSSVKKAYDNFPNARISKRKVTFNPTTGDW
ncbi:MAG: hypothetical protein AAF621_05450 [Pseudomonadota bacterium]